MKANERRMAILEALCERRHEQVANLSFEFGVTSWTIRQDIAKRRDEAIALMGECLASV